MIPVNGDQLGNVLLIAWTIPAVLAPLLYTRVPWRRSPLGVHLMAFMSVMALVSVLGCIRLFFGDAPWFAALRAVSYVGVVIVMWWRLLVVAQAVRDAARDERAEL